MGYQALYRTWRPTCFGDVVGQEPIVSTLAHQIESGRISHAYLFCGTRGTGKTTTAKVFARSINCSNRGKGAEACGACPACLAFEDEGNLDIQEIDAASNTGVDNVRSLIESIRFPPAVGAYKVYIIDEVHMLSAAAFNALLKTLEEPPEHAVFILATTEPHKLPMTVLSRCQRFDFKRISAEVIIHRLKVILKGIDRRMEEEGLAMIARAAEGGMRDAISLMDLCLSSREGELSGEHVREVLGISDGRFVFDFVQALLDDRGAQALEMVGNMMESGQDPAVFTKEVIAHLRALLLAQFEKEPGTLLETTVEDARRYREQSQGVPREAILRRLDIFLSAQGEMRLASQPRTMLELAAVRACHPEREDTTDALIERLDKVEKALREGAVAIRPSPPKDPKGKKEKKEDPPPKPAEKPKIQGSPELERLWQKAMERVKEREMSLYSLLMKGEVRLMALSDGIARLQLALNKKMFLALIEKEEKKAIVERALSELVEAPVTVRFVVEGAVPANAHKAQDHSMVYETFGRDKVVLVDE
ncbi:MAG: DNA polymerase III subunit gamma/tau [Clostridiales bacterium]|nr:DNA polymerase III subunit gamma/tau [Bacillota bacterium]NLL54226.1 DNA polymerase III subunit gamma/tau [Clostridiales bacterium]